MSVFVVTHMQVTESFVFTPMSPVTPQLPSVSFSLQCALCSHSWINSGLVYCGQAHHVYYQFTLSQSMRLREQVHSLSVKNVHGHVEICVAEREVASDTDLRAV